MLNKILSITKGNFFKNVLILMSGTALAQIITFALMPVITRIYGPEPIGVLGTFTAITAIIVPLIALTYPIAIVKPKDHYKGRAIAKLAIMLSVIMTLVILVTIFVLESAIIQALSLESIGMFIYLIPVFLLGMGFTQVLEQWLIRTKAFKVNAKTAVWQSIFINGSKIGGGVLYPFSATLIILQTIGVYFRAGLMYFLSDRSIVNRSEKHSLNDIKTVARENSDFPKYRAPQVSVNALSQGLPVLLLASFFGPAIAGFYALGRQALSTPVQLLGKAVQDVFYPKINEMANNKKKVFPIMTKAIITLAAIGVIPFGIIIIFGPSIFSLIFGAEWFTAGEYARWIGLVAYAMLITRPVIVSIPVLDIQKHFLFIEIVGTIGKAGALIAGVYFFADPIYAIAMFSVASIMMYGYLTVHTLAVGKRFDRVNVV